MSTGARPPESVKDQDLKEESEPKLVLQSSLDPLRAEDSVQAFQGDLSRSTSNETGLKEYKGDATLKLNDLPILRPPEGFRAPIIRCRAPSIMWKHCSCPSHSHLPLRRQTFAPGAWRRGYQDPLYRTWPNRASRRFVRPMRRTVGTQSCMDGTRSSLRSIRCVVRSIDMTETAMDEEIGVSIPF